MSATGTAREEHPSMEFSVTKSALLNELSTTQGVVERKTTIPILSNLLVEAKGSQLTITATDASMTYGAAVPSFSVTYNGFLNGDTPASLTTAPSVTTAATSDSHVHRPTLTPDRRAASAFPPMAYR